jgi:predicted RNase H-like nuclease (RuvC/YqgF family)
VSYSVGVQTRFVLSAKDGQSNSGIERTELELKIKNTQDDLEMARLRVEQARGRVAIGTESALNLREAENRLRQLERELVAQRARHEHAAAGTETAIMDSSFTMAVGETVVVGTSRLGGDKALIALVTAVPKGNK